MDSGPGSAVRTISGFFFVFLFVYGMTNGRSDPFLVPALSAIFLLIGIPSAVFGIQNNKQNQHLMDYEPTTLFGRPSKGKDARDIVQTFGTVGVWSILLGIAFAVSIFIK